MKMKAFCLMVVVLFAVTLVSAAQPFPHDFEGYVISEDGSSANAKTLMVSVDGAVTGSAKIVGDYYKVTALDNTGYGDVVRFFIGDEEAEESFNYRIFGDTIANLTFSRIPDLPGVGVGFCGDDVCAINECSFCAIDCPVSLCLGDGVCNDAIGEDYVTAPGDCVVCGDGVVHPGENCSSCPADVGACVVNSPGNGGGSSDGGSGGGGGGSSGGGGSFGGSLPVKALVDEDDSGSDDVSGLGIQELNDLDDDDPVVRPDGFFSAITGAVIGGGVGSVAVAGAFLLLAIGGFFAMRVRSLKKRGGGPRDTPSG